MGMPQVKFVRVTGTSCNPSRRRPSTSLNRPAGRTKPGFAAKNASSFDWYALNRK